MRMKMKSLTDIYGKFYFKSTGIEEYFSTLEENKLPTWRDELYYNAHQGTYTTSAISKKLNRRAEELLHTIEAVSVIGGLINSKTATEKLWKKTLVLQFHDQLPGTCVKEALQDSRDTYKQIFAEGEKVRERALRTIFGKSKTDNIGIYNQLGFMRNDYSIVEAEKGYFTDLHGKQLASQKIGLNKWLLASGHIDSFSGKMIKMASKPKNVLGNSLKKPFSATLNEIATPFYNVNFEKGGILTLLQFSKSKKKIITTPSNLFQMFLDDNSSYPAWDISYDFAKIPAEKPKCCKWQLINIGPLRTTYQSEWRIGKSQIIQYIHFYRDIKRIDFETEINWLENARLLKIAFCPNLNTDSARYETQFGTIKRGLTGKNIFEKVQFEVPHLRWADMSEDNLGMALMNDCKYGIDASPGMLRLSLLRAPDYPNPEIDRGKHYFVYSLYPHECSFKNSHVVERALELNMQLISVKNVKNNPETFVKLKKGKIIVDTIKWAEDSNDIIIRVYEPYHRRSVQSEIFVNGASKIFETNILEHNIREILCDNNSFNFILKKAEIKTFRIIRNKKV